MASSFLFVRKDDSASLRILVWLKRAKEKDYDLRLAPKVVDVETLVCGGVTRRLREFPCLVIQGRDAPVYGFEPIKDAFLGVRRRRAERRADTTPSVASPAAATGQRRPRRRQRRQPRRRHGARKRSPGGDGGCGGGPRPFGQEGALASVDMVGLRGTRTPGAGSRAQVESVPGFTPPSQRGGSMREQKVEALESDLEALIASRKAIGGGIRRV